MKKLILVLICLLTLGYVNNYNAMTCDQLKLTAIKDNFATKGTLELKFEMSDLGNITKTYPSYKLAQNSGAVPEYEIFCRNPLLAAVGSGVGYNMLGNSNFVCADTLFDLKEGKTKEQNAYEYGVIQILKYSENEVITYENEVITTALRIYESLWPTYDTNGGYNRDHELVYATNYMTNEYLGDKDVKKLLNTLKNDYGYLIRTDTYDDLTISEYQWIDNEGNDKTEILKGLIKNVIIIGLKSAINYAESKVATITYSGPVVKAEDEKVTYDYKFDIKNFVNNASILMDLKCNNCDDYRIKIKGEDTKETNDVDVLKYVSNGNGEITVSLEFDRIDKKKICKNIDFSLDIKYKDDTNNLEGFVVHEDNFSGQRLYMLYEQNVYKTINIKKTISNLCENEIVDNACITHIDNDSCDSDGATINITEGVYCENGVCTKNGKLNVDNKECIIGNSDHQVTSSSVSGDFDNVSNNQYCNIYCKEDYHLNFPGIKAANSGRYFSLNASVEGTQTCYMEMTDAADNIEDELKILRNDIIEAYNDWSYWNAASNATLYYDTSEDEDFSTSYSCDQPDCCEDENECDPVIKENCGGENTKSFSAHIEFTSYWTDEFSYDICDDSGCRSSSDQLREDGYAGWNCWCTNSEPICEAYDEDGDLSYIDDERENAILKLEAAIQAYAEEINKYNSCYGNNITKYNESTLKGSDATGWSIGDYYQASIEFTYDEKDYMKILNNNQLSLSKIEYDPELYQSNINSETITKFICYKSGGTYACGKKTFTINTSESLTQTRGVEAHYITPTNFYTIYPYGAITNKETANSSVLENKLPISFSTKAGSYPYKLRVLNLGQYYDSSQLGRLWGNDDSLIIEALNTSYSNDTTKGEAVTTNNSGEYVCKYKVNCPDCLVVCENCLIKDGQINTSYKPVTPNYMHPINPNMGVNWQFDDNITTIIESKACITTSEIKKDGEEIYSNNTSSNTFKITLDRQVMNKIKDLTENYNYTDNTLKCYDYDYNGETFENIFCYSTIIDELVYSVDAKKIQVNGIDVKGNQSIRQTGNNETNSDNLRSANPDPRGYWITWDKANNGVNWIVDDISCKYVSTYHLGIGGPAWK